MSQRRLLALCTAALAVISALTFAVSSTSAAAGPRVTVHASLPTTIRGGSVVLSGSVEGVWTGHDRVLIEGRRGSQASWHPLAERRISDHGSYRFTWNPTRLGRFRIRALEVVLANGRVKARSSAVTVRVVRPSKLAVQVNGLPPGAAGDVSISGPNGFADWISATAVITGLVPGVYAIRPSTVEASSGTYRPTASKASLRLSSGGLSSVDVTYTSPTPTPSPSPSTTPTPTPTPTPTTAAMTDNFHRSDRDIAGDRTPSGSSYLVQNDQGGTGLRISAEQLVRGQPQNWGPAGAPVLIWPLPSTPTSVGASFVFVPGTAAGQNAVVGACPQGFGSSVQLAVYPTRWILFYTYQPDPSIDGSSIVNIATGSIAPLAVDGVTEYQMGMEADLATSTVTISYPGGSETISDPAISKYWGSRLGVQVRRPHASDGDARFTSISASWMSS